MHARHQLEVSPSCSGTALPSPSILTHPGASTPLDSRLEGSMAAENRACAPFVQFSATTADGLDTK